MRYLTVLVLCFTVALSSCAPQPSYPAEFPLQPLTAKQIADAAACDVEKVMNEKYGSLTPRQLEAVSDPETNCEWAALADAYSARSDQGLEAYKHSIDGNYAYALIAPNVESYFGKFPLVKAPPVAGHDIYRAVIFYEFTGAGMRSLQYSLDISGVDPSAVFSQSPEVTDGITIDTSILRDLGNGLTDLIPVDGRGRVHNECMEFGSSWIVILQYTGGDQLVIQTAGNAMPFGGPWYTEIGGQVYMQASPAFGEKLGALIKALGPPVGPPGDDASSFDPMLFMCPQTSANAVLQAAYYKHFYAK
jgi:hypothetical protein